MYLFEEACIPLQVWRYSQSFIIDEIYGRFSYRLKSMDQPSLSSESLGCMQMEFMQRE